MTNNSIEIRSMEKGDLEAVSSIQETIIQGRPSSTWKMALADQVGRSFSRSLVAVKDGQVVGFIISDVNQGAFGADLSGWLGWIGVSPKLMGQGVGRALALKLFELFKEEGVENIYTAVRWDSVDMLSFFKSLGFDRSNFINLRKRLD